MSGALQVNLAHKKQRLQTLQWDCAWGLMVVLGESAVSYERGTSVQTSLPHCGLGDVECVWDRRREIAAHRCDLIRISVTVV